MEPTATHALSLAELVKLEGLTPLVEGVYIQNVILGEGKFGKVQPGYILDEHRKPRRVAIKLHKDNSNIDLFQQEIRIMQKLNHSNIVKLKKFGRTPDGVYYMAMERLNMNLQTILASQPNKVFSEDEVRPYFSDICEGVKYLHENNICHRDIKPENIMTDDEHNLKLCDFGLAREFQEGRVCQSVVGTTPFLSPQLLEGKNYSGNKADVFALGKTLLYLLTGLYSDIQDIKDKRSAEAIEHAKRRLASKIKIPNHLSTKVRDLLEKMLNPIDEMRITIHDVWDHEWFSVLGAKEGDLRCSRLQNHQLRQSMLGDQLLKKKSDVKQLRTNVLHDFMAMLRKQVIQKITAYLETVVKVLKYMNRGDTALAIEAHPSVHEQCLIRCLQIAYSLKMLANVEFSHESNQGQANLLHVVYSCSPHLKRDIEEWRTGFEQQLGEYVETNSNFKQLVSKFAPDQIAKRFASLMLKTDIQVPQSAQMDIFCPNEFPQGEITAFWCGELALSNCSLRIEVDETELVRYLSSNRWTSLEVKEIRFHIVLLCKQVRFMDSLKDETKDKLDFRIPGFENFMKIDFQLQKLYKKPNK